MSPRSATRIPVVLIAAAAASVGVAPTPTRPAAAAQPGNALELVFSYGSEKKEWLQAVTADYLATNPTVGGQPVRVKLVPMGSGECMDAVRDPDGWEKRADQEVQRTEADLAEARRLAAQAPGDPAAAARLKAATDALRKAADERAAARAHLVSPASRAFLQLANGDCQKAGQPDLVGPDALKPEKGLVQSPVIIAMWEDMARELGWPDKEVGWADVYDLAVRPGGWAAKNSARKGWGRFKFGHTNPELSNSGLIAVLAEAYYGAEKTEKLTVEDVGRKAVRERMAGIEQAVLFYGQSTGFFGTQMVAGGPDLLSAAVLYEDQVIKANQGGKLDPRLVAVYPKEGTFLSDHPVGVVRRPWVTRGHEAAAEAYVKFLRDPAQQRKAMAFGFRPGVKMALDPKVFTKDLGVDPDQPRADDLEVPPAEVMRAVLGLWAEVRKPIRVVLVIDKSGSMINPNRQKLVSARDAAAAFVGMLRDRDELTLLTFNSDFAWEVPAPLRMDAAGKAAAVAKIKSIRAEYQTALHDAIGQAFDQIKAEGRTDRTTAVVVLSDGEDYGENPLVRRNGKAVVVPPKGEKPGDLPVLGPDGKPVTLGSTITLDDLLAKIKFDPEGSATRVFTIAYGADANPAVLDRISKATRGVMYPSNPGDIDKVFKLILENQ